MDSQQSRNYLGRNLRDIARMLERELVPIDRDAVREFSERRGLLEVWMVAQRHARAR